MNFFYRGEGVSLKISLLLSKGQIFCLQSSLERKMYGSTWWASRVQNLEAVSADIMAL